MLVSFTKLFPKSNSLNSIGDKKTSGVKVTNARSVKGKIANIQDLILNEHANLACITETGWMKLGELVILSFVQGPLCRNRPDLKGGEKELL